MAEIRTMTFTRIGGSALNQLSCDESPMKEQLKQQLSEITNALQHSLSLIDDDNHCLLSDFEEIRESFKQAESVAASFYLRCYLSAFSIDYTAISLTIQHLSTRRHGALIMIQRKEPLHTFIHSGIAIGAQLSHSLLESIFYPGNPLHDGAVLIIENQIVSAANVLPVSTVSVDGKKLGTRHRAAIGLSEQTDALVIVISEESGQSSFAYKGSLYPVSFSIAKGLLTNS